MSTTYSKMLERIGEPYVRDGVGDGWVPIVERLIADLRSSGWTGKIDQIKEKWGGLRFYADGEGMDGNEFWDRITLAELEASRTCELCGKPGGMTEKFGWYVTLCQECNERPIP